MMSDFILEWKNLEKRFRIWGRPQKPEETGEKSLDFFVLLFIIFFFGLFITFFLNSVLVIWEHLNRAEAHECAELALLCRCEETALSQPPQRTEGSSWTPGPAELRFLYQAVCRRVQLVVGQHLVFTALTTHTLQGSLASLNFGACWQPSSQPLDQYQWFIQYEKRSSCISKVDASEGGIVITWSVFLRHPCPRSPTAEPGPSTCFFAGCASSHCQAVAGFGLMKWKLLAKIKFSRRVSVLQGCDRPLTQSRRCICFWVLLILYR